MEPFNIVIAIAIIAISIAGLAVIAELWLHHPAPGVLDDDHLTLCYCQGCGCRHRTEWMVFDSLGVHRCIICCQAELSSR